MKGYCTIDDIKNYNLTEIAESFESQIESWIGIAESIIERETGRVFKVGSTESDRIYDGYNTRDLSIDDCLSVSEVKIYDCDGNLAYTLDENGFVLSPYNSNPKMRMFIKPSQDAVFKRGTGNIVVTGVWGYSETVPPEITYATVVLVSGIMNNGNDAPGEKKSEKIGDYMVTYKDDTGWSDFKKMYDIINIYKSPKMYV